MKPTQNEWDLIAGCLKKRAGKEDFAAWFKSMHPIADSREDGISLAMPTRFISDYVKGNWNEVINEECHKVIGKVDISYVVQQPVEPPKETKAFREVPEADLQPDMFIPDIAEIPIKDDVHLMEIAPFTLQPRGEKRTELIYDGINGVNIRIKANPDYGLITSLDYDLVLMMQSWLAELANEYREKLARHKRTGKGKAPAKPPRYFEPHVKEILLFARNYEKAGANQRERVEGMLERLKGTEVRISKAGRKKRRWGSFSFIQDWEILEETKTGNILQVKIDIPRWIYEGIVEAPTPTILTYEPDYFLIKKPILRFIYRFCRLNDGKLSGLIDNIEFPTSEIHMRSGSRRALKDFNRDLRTAVKGLKGGEFFKWILSIDGQRNKSAMTIRRKPELIE